MKVNKIGVSGMIGAVGGMVATALGGWDYGLQTLVLFMAVDFLTGMIVAGVFHRSPKTGSGALNSDVGLRGICKKAMMLLLVLAAVRLDLLFGSDYLRDAAVIALVANELVSIVENAGLMGAPIPSVIKKAIDLLCKKEDGGA